MFAHCSQFEAALRDGKECMTGVVCRTASGERRLSLLCVKSIRSSLAKPKTLHRFVRLCGMTCLLWLNRIPCCATSGLYINVPDINHTQLRVACRRKQHQKKSLGQIFRGAYPCYIFVCVYLRQSRGVLRYDQRGLGGRAGPSALHTEGDPLAAGKKSTVGCRADCNGQGRRAVKEQG